MMFSSPIDIQTKEIKIINKKTNEWLMQTLNNKIISCSRTGGKNGWQLYSISRWTEDDGKKLKSI